MVKIEWEQSEKKGYCTGQISDLSDKPVHEILNDIKSGNVFDYIKAEWTEKGNTTITITAFDEWGFILAKSSRTINF